MEVAAFGLGGGGFDFRGPEVFHDEVGDAGFYLKFSGDAEEGLGLGEEFVLLKDFLPEDKVDEAGFVFEGVLRGVGRD